MTWDRIGGKQLKKKKRKEKEKWSLAKITLHRPYSLKNKDNIFIFQQNKALVYDRKKNP